MVSFKPDCDFQGLCSFSLMWEFNKDPLPLKLWFKWWRHNIPNQCLINISNCSSHAPLSGSLGCANLMNDDEVDFEAETFEWSSGVDSLRARLSSNTVHFSFWKFSAETQNFQDCWIRHKSINVPTRHRDATMLQTTLNLRIKTTNKEW